MTELPTLEAAISNYDSDLKFVQEKYLNLVGKRAQAVVSLAGLKAMPSIRVVAPAVRPDQKFWPKTFVLYPLAIMGGLLLGLIVALAKIVILGRIRREHLVQGRGPVPLYGLVGAPAPAPRIVVVMPERLAPPAAT